MIVSQTWLFLLPAFLIICCIAREHESKNKKHHHHQAAKTDNYYDVNVSGRSTARQNYNYNSAANKKSQMNSHFVKAAKPNKEFFSQYQKRYETSKPTASLHHRRTGNYLKKDKEQEKNEQPDYFLSNDKNNNLLSSQKQRPYYKNKNDEISKPNYHDSSRRNREKVDPYFNETKKEKTTKEFASKHNHGNGSGKPSKNYAENNFSKSSEDNDQNKDKNTEKRSNNKHHKKSSTASTVHRNQSASRNHRQSYKITSKKGENMVSLKSKPAKKYANSNSSEPQYNQSASNHGRNNKKQGKHHHHHSNTAAKDHRSSNEQDNGDPLLSNSNEVKNVKKFHKSKKKKLAKKSIFAAKKHDQEDSSKISLSYKEEDKTEKRFASKHHPSNEGDKFGTKQNYSFATNKYRKRNYHNNAFLQYLTKVKAINRLANYFMTGVKIDSNTKKATFKWPRRKRNKERLFETRFPTLSEIYAMGQELERRLVNVLKKRVKVPSRNNKNFAYLIRGAKDSKKGLERLLVRIKNLF